MDSVVFVMIKHGFKQENQRPKTSQTFWRKQASKDWNAEKAMKQMREVSKNWSSVEETLIALGFRR